MSEADGLIGAVVLGATGNEVGTVVALRVDPDGRQARWLDLTLPDGTTVTVPAQAASADGAGHVMVPFGEDDLRSAPRPDGPVVSADLAAALLRHYGFPPETL